jgi:F-type H+-transporting ATPase subunit c
MMLMLLVATPAMAQDEELDPETKKQMAIDEAKAAGDASIARASNWGIGFGAGIGACLTIIGAGYGISTIAGRAVESMARQPEVAGNIQGAMIISAALIEGVTFFSLIVCILILVLA